MSDSDDRKIFVGGLSATTNEEALKSYFSQFANVVSCVLMRDEMGRSRNFGFVEFDSAAVIPNIIAKKHILDGRQIDPKTAVPRGQQQQPGRPGGQQQNVTYMPFVPGATTTTATSKAVAVSSPDFNKIFAGGLHVESSEEDVKQFFSQFGPVIEVILVRNHDTGRSRGFAFVTFADHESMDKSLQNRFIRMGMRTVEVKPAAPKGSLTPTNPVQSMFNPAASMTASMNPAANAATAAAAAMNPAALTSAYYEAMMKAYGSTYSPEMIAAAAAYYSQMGMAGMATGAIPAMPGASPSLNPTGAVDQSAQASAQPTTSEEKTSSRDSRRDHKGEEDEENDRYAGESSESEASSYSRNVRESSSRWEHRDHSASSRSSSDDRRGGDRSAVEYGGRRSSDRDASSYRDPRDIRDSRDARDSRYERTTADRRRSLSPRSASSSRAGPPADYHHHRSSGGYARK